MLPLLEEAYIDTGKVYFVYKDYPVIGGDIAYIGSLAGQCAGEQDLFWEMNDWLFNNVGVWRSQDVFEQLNAAAVDLGLDGEAFATCLEEQGQRDLIVEDYEEGQKFGVQGTPNFVINGRLVQGALPMEAFSGIIDALIEEAESGELPAGAATVTPTATPDRDFAEESVSSRGDPDAPVVIVEFSDYQCPFCRRHFLETMPKLIEDYIDTGKVRYVFKDFPLTNIHPQAVEASFAAECAGEQDAYWEMHDKLYTEQERWAGVDNATEVFSDFADELGLDTEAFTTCVSDARYQEDVIQNFQEGVNAGVSGTPAFFINGVFVSGAQPYEVFQQIIEDALAAQ